jgi:hypothetical protein
MTAPSLATRTSPETPRKAGAVVGDDGAMVTVGGESDLAQLVAPEGLGECGPATCPLAFRILTTCDPMSPVPPI